MSSVSQESSIAHRTEHVDAVSGAARIKMGLAEFIFTIAVMTACVALAIDSMLPALQSIGQSFDIANANDAQLVARYRRLDLAVRLTVVRNGRFGATLAQSGPVAELDDEAHAEWARLLADRMPEPEDD